MSASVTPIFVPLIHRETAELKDIQRALVQHVTYHRLGGDIDDLREKLELVRNELSLRAELAVRNSARAHN